MSPFSFTKLQEPALSNLRPSWGWFSSLILDHFSHVQGWQVNHLYFLFLHTWMLLLWPWLVLSMKKLPSIHQEYPCLGWSLANASLYLRSQIRQYNIWKARLDSACRELIEIVKNNSLAYSLCLGRPRPLRSHLHDSVLSSDSWPFIRSLCP